jgi:hypothetical protein
LEDDGDFGFGFADSGAVPFLDPDLDFDAFESEDEPDPPSSDPFPTCFPACLAGRSVDPPSSSEP